MRVFADCCVNGFKRCSPEYYRGDWGRCMEAAAAIRARIRGDIGVLANRPGELRIHWEDPRLTVALVLIDAALALDIWTDGIAEVFEIEVENPANMWYPSLEGNPIKPGEE